MFGKQINLFRLFGFQVRVDASWVLVAVLIAWSLAVSLFPVSYPRLPQSTYWLMGGLGMIGLFASIIFHELCHSLVARQYGLDMKGITLFIFGGVAEMGDEPASAKVEFLMAIAGPAASVVLGLICLALSHTVAPGWPVIARGVVAYLGWINLVLAGFNLIPAFPLDGGRVLRSILWRWKRDLLLATRIASTVGGVLAVLLMLFAALQLFTGQFVSAVWLFLIGLFIRSASRQSWDQLVMKSTLKGVPVRKFMRTDPVTAPGDLTVARLVDEYLYKHHYQSFPVVEDTGELIGCVGASGAGGLSREKWPWRTVRDIMTPCAAQSTIQPDTDALDALTLMSKTRNNRLMVVENGRLVGILTLRDLMRFLATKLELEGRAVSPQNSAGPEIGSHHHPATHHSA